MKKITIVFLMLVTVLGLQAQTNFRKLSFDQGIEAAKRENKLLFVDFHTSWCGPCKRMAREVFPQKEVGDYMNSHFVCLAIDAEKGEGVALAKTYKVTAYPTLAIINPDKSLKGTVIGYRDPQQLTNELERITNPKMSPAVLKERFGKGERTPELVSAYAALVYDEGYQSRDRKKYEQARVTSDSIVNSYFCGLKDKQRLDPANKFVYMSYSRDVYGPAMQYMIHHLDKMTAFGRADLDSVVKENYYQAVASALCHSKATNAQIDSLENDLKFLQLNNDGKYDVALKMARAYRAGNMDEYIDFAHRSFTKLPSNLRTYYAETFAGLFKNCDTATKKRAAWIVRDGLSILPSIIIYFASEQLRTLEGDGYADPVRE